MLFVTCNATHLRGMEEWSCEGFVCPPFSCADQRATKHSSRISAFLLRSSPRACGCSSSATRRVPVSISVRATLFPVSISSLLLLASAPPLPSSPTTPACTSRKVGSSSTILSSSRRCPSAAVAAASPSGSCRRPLSRTLCLRFVRCVDALIFLIQVLPFLFSHSHQAGPALFGPNMDEHQATHFGSIIPASPPTLCVSPPPGSYRGKIVAARRGGCMFVQKVPSSLSPSNTVNSISLFCSYTRRDTLSLVVRSP
jgi:hypothetical protein